MSPPLTSDEARSQIYDLTDRQLKLMTLLLIENRVVYPALNLKPFERKFLESMPEIYDKFGFTWKQRRKLREILIEATSQLIDRAELAELKEGS